jgi:serine/threonine protein kinase
MIETGKLLQNRYRIDKQIGQGGMGAVYVASDERFGSTVAIKETLLMDDNYRKAIEREARLLNSLKHAALPRVSDHFLEENGQFLVMEYIPGEDLSHMIESGTRFEVARVLKWADQLLDALDYLHNQSIPVIHRDIKPQNLKLTARDQIILLDFGLAKGNPTDAGHQTAAKSIFGYSRNYASLEQIQGTGTDPRSDLYSLAATLYHLLTNTPPEDALTRAMAVLSNRPDPLQPANALRKEIPAGVAAVLQTALALNADERPESATAMREMLRDHAKYAPFLEQAVNAANPTRGDVLAQETKIMASDTRHEIGGETDVKTAIMPGFVSQETAVRPVVTGEVGSPKRGRRGVMIAGALVAVLIGCVSAGALYFYDPSVFGAREEMPIVAQPEAKPAPITQEPSNANIGAVAESESAVNSGQSEVARQSSTTAGTKSGETAKSTKQQHSKDETDSDNENDLKIDGDTVYTGNTKIGPDGITRAKPNVYVDPNGIRHPIPPSTMDYPFPGITREQFNRMTPQQRQKLIEARRRLIMLQKRGIQPPDTPE